MHTNLFENNKKKNIKTNFRMGVRMSDMCYTYFSWVADGFQSWLLGVGVWEVGVTNIVMSESINPRSFMWHLEYQ